MVNSSLPAARLGGQSGGQGGQPVPQALLVAYPLWDALANFIDARSNGGLSRNRTQAINVGVSSLAAISIAAGARIGMNAMLAVFGAWALLSGLMQLATGMRRWTVYGAQWAMILSGAQSVLAGVFMVKMAAGGQVIDTLTRVAPYAGFGAFYFLVSALWLTLKDAKSAHWRSLIDLATAELLLAVAVTIAGRSARRSG